MRYAILSDVHANRQALEAVLADARRMGAETVVSLGDAVGYGPLPAEAVARVRETCAITLAGNHDDAVSGRIAAEGFIELASDAVQRHRDALSADALAWLKSLPYAAEIEGAVCAHGDLVDPPKFYYIEDEADAAANFQAAAFPLAFVGHTHRPAVFVIGASGKAHKIDPQDFTLEDGKRYIVNVGSVGYPRESGGVCRSSYVLYDSMARTVEFRFLPFSVASVLQRGRGPKTGKKLLFALGALALAAIGACVWSLSRPRGNRDEGATSRDYTLLTNETLYVSPTTRELRANLFLVRKTGPADLRIRFYAADRQLLKEHTLTIPLSSSKNLLNGKEKLTIPPTARTVNLAVLKTKAVDANPRIDRFEPAAR